MAMHTVRPIQNAVYHEIRKGIMTLSLKPGEVISTQEMATRLDVSRTPVREAFISLQREELVKSVPQKGTIVSRINLKRVEQERFVRESLEIPMVDLFLHRYDVKCIELLKANLEEQRRAGEKNNAVHFVYLDDLFHKILFDAAGADLAWDTVSAINGHYHRIRILSVNRPNTLDGSITQHQQIIRMLEEKDVKGIKELLTDHVRKINYENPLLLKEYPDYFEQGEEQHNEFRINKLRYNHSK